MHEVHEERQIDAGMEQMARKMDEGREREGCGVQGLGNDVWRFGGLEVVRWEGGRRMGEELERGGRIDRFRRRRSVTPGLPLECQPLLPDRRNPIHEILDKARLKRPRLALLRLGLEVAPVLVETGGNGLLLDHGRLPVLHRRHRVDLWLIRRHLVDVLCPHLLLSPLLPFSSRQLPFGRKNRRGGFEFFKLSDKRAQNLQRILSCRWFSPSLSHTHGART